MRLSHRYADREDLPQVYLMYLEGLRELNEPYDEKKALEFLLFCWSQAPCVLLLKGTEIIGFAGLNTFNPAYNDEVYLRDYMFYIQPGHRGIKPWRELCKAVQKVADIFKITFIGEHRLSGSIKHHERLIRMAGAVPKAVLSVYGGNNG